MPSFRSGLRNTQRFERDPEECFVALRDYGARSCSSDSASQDYKRRVSSLPMNCSSVSVKLVPSLRHSMTAPEICVGNKAIPKDVIETDFLDLSQISHSTTCLASDGSTTKNDESQVQKAEVCRCETSAEPPITAHSPTCHELRKALLDGLDHRIVPGRRTNPGNYKLLLSADLLDRVSVDIVRMSQREPSGVNGCRLRTRLERQESADMDLGCVRISDDTEETFEIVLSLKESKDLPDRKGPSLRSVSSLLSTILSRHRLHPMTIRVGDAYQLEKIRLHHHSEDQHHQTTAVKCAF